MADSGFMGWFIAGKNTPPFGHGKKIADKYGIGLRELKARAKREGWAA